MCLFFFPQTLQEQNRELSVKNGEITTEISRLHKDVLQWCQRANTLVERPNKDPKEFEHIQDEHEQLGKMLSIEKEKIVKAEAQLVATKQEAQCIDIEIAFGLAALKANLKTFKTIATTVGLAALAATQPAQLIHDNIPDDRNWYDLAVRSNAKCVPDEDIEGGRLIVRNIEIAVGLAALIATKEFNENSSVNCSFPATHRATEENECDTNAKDATELVRKDGKPTSVDCSPISKKRKLDEAPSNDKFESETNFAMALCISSGESENHSPEPKKRKIGDDGISNNNVLYDLAANLDVDTHQNSNLNLEDSRRLPNLVINANTEDLN